MMDFKISIRCEKCKCSFELRPINFSDGESLSCPNCKACFPENVFSHLKSGIMELAKVPEAIPDDGSASQSSSKKSRQFTLKVKEYDEIIDLLNLKKD